MLDGPLLSIAFALRLNDSNFYGVCSRFRMARAMLMPSRPRSLILTAIEVTHNEVVSNVKTITFGSVLFVKIGRENSD